MPPCLCVVHFTHFTKTAGRRGQKRGFQKWQYSRQPAGELAQNGHDLFRSRSTTRTQELAVCRGCNRDIHAVGSDLTLPLSLFASPTADPVLAADIHFASILLIDLGSFYGRVGDNDVEETARQNSQGQRRCLEVVYCESPALPGYR